MVQRAWLFTEKRWSARHSYLAAGVPLRVTISLSDCSEGVMSNRDVRAAAVGNLEKLSASAARQNVFWAPTPLRQRGVSRADLLETRPPLLASRTRFLKALSRRLVRFS